MWWVDILNEIAQEKKLLHLVISVRRVYAPYTLTKKQTAEPGKPRQRHLSLGLSHAYICMLSFV
jgi:hypothetical protein